MECGDNEPVPGSHCPGEIVVERENILFPLSQRGKVNWYKVDEVEQLSIEQPLVSLKFQVAFT